MVFLKGRICLLLLGLSLLVLCASYSLAKEDPELRQCKHQCRHQRQFDERQIEHCEISCEDYIKDKERIQRERERGESNPARRDVEEEDYKECRERCQQGKQGRKEEQLCESQCEVRKRQQERGDSKEEPFYRREHEGWEEERSESGHPYVFWDKHFSTKFRTQEGRVSVLEKFSERSEIFNGIDNFRVLIFEANPQTFVIPSHWDADIVFFVAQGEGTVHLVFTDKRESFNIERGQVMVIPAGITAYMINRNNTEKLVLIKIVNPVSNTGQFVPFFGPGGKDPQSFFNAFSSGVLEAMFKAPRDIIQRVLSQQRDGVIIRASKEQISSMTHHTTGLWPFKVESSKELAPFQLLKDSQESNKFGQLFEENKKLKHLNMAISFANITRGSMHTPYYNTRATKIAVVVNGTGYFEMACPHASSSGHGHDHHSRNYIRKSTWRSTPVDYERISSELEPGMAFIVPAGHPFVTMASQDENLELLCFEINAENNHKFRLAGDKSILKNIDRDAKELAFATSAEEVDRLLESQEEDFFFPGPKQHQRHPGAATF